MKILYAATTPLAGVCELMARCVNEYYGKEHEARVLSRGPGKHLWYIRPGTKVIRHHVRHRDQIDPALQWADVIHCMANVSARSLKRLDLLKKKTWVFQWHGAQIWPFTNVWFEEDYPHVKWIHIGQGWNRDPWFDRFNKFGLKLIPNVISADDEIHTPLPWKRRLKQSVAFSPSNAKAVAVNKKGIPEVTRACKGHFTFDLISGTSFEECMKRKRKAWLGIDEIVTPLYHRSGLEFLSQGVPCICSHDEFTASCLKEVTGAECVPFINANKDTLRKVISDHMAKPVEELQQMGRDARAWIEEYYHPRALLQRYFEVYQ